MASGLMAGNSAVIVGALYAGCDCFFGYPITPASEILQEASKFFPLVGRKFVQAESEEAAINMVYGAATAGHRVLAASSGPGMSLKQEGITYIAGAQLPCVIVDICRAGPGLGNIGPEQSDYNQACKGGGHGCYHNIVLAPASVQEMCDFTRKGFDLAFKYRNPVMVLADAIIGQMKEPVVPWVPENRDPEEGQSWGLQGAVNRPPRLIKSLFLDDGALAGQNLKLQAKYKAMQAEVDQELFLTEDAELIVVAFGSIGRIAKSTVRKLRAQGKKVGLFRPITLFPFPSDVLLGLARQGKRFLTIEHNMGQMVEDVRLAIRTVADSAFHAQLPGNLPTPDDFEEPILKALEG